MIEEESLVVVADGFWWYVNIKRVSLFHFANDFVAGLWYLFTELAGQFDEDTRPRG